MVCVKSDKKCDFLNTDIYIHRLICKKKDTFSVVRFDSSASLPDVVNKKKKIHLVLSDAIALLRFPML